MSGDSEGRDGPTGGAVVVRTSESGWLEKLAASYRHRRPAILVDDKGIGVDPRNDTLFNMGVRAKLSQREVVAVCLAVGISAAGVGIILIAFFDPEPTSKLSILLAGGVVLIATGGLTGIRVLTGHKPPNVLVNAGLPPTFEIRW